MSPKENYLACLNHKPHEYTPGFVDAFTVGNMLPIERGPGGSGVDAFGVRWVAPITGGPGSALPAPDEFMLDDVTNWKKVITIPDVSAVDWEGIAAMEEANFNRDEKVVEVWHSNCIFERLATFMGFEGALLAMALEPEATFELLSALTDWRITMINYFHKYFKPDVYIYFDDVATERMLFMSPDCYRQLIKPLHTKLAAACKELGIIPVQHTCGKADIIVQDMIDEGNHGWHAVQATNNLEDIIQEHGDYFVLSGGFNSNGPPGLETASEDVVRAEVRRCIETYGRFGKGYIFRGSTLVTLDSNNPFNFGPLNAAIADEFLKIREEKTA
jgi:hypothetical protein